VRAWILIGVLYGTAVLIACASYVAINDQTGPNLTDDIAMAQAKFASATQAVADMQPQFVEARLKLDASRAVTTQPNWSILLALLAESRGDQIVLRQCKLRPVTADVSYQAAPALSTTANPVGTKPRRDAYTLTIRGIGETQPTVSQFVLRLEQMQLFDRVDIIKTQRKPFGNRQAVAFELECALGHDVENYR
jgi:hypothetical protein